MQPDAQVFVALADPTRRQLLMTLAESSPKTATQLKHGFRMSRQGVLKHLDVLAGAGLVRVQTHGREKRYWLEPQPLASVSAWMDAVGAAWDARLARLKEQVEGEDD
jgi:DNA-binding transcriptional ArsR family regulator